MWIESSYWSTLRPQMMFTKNTFIADNRWFACEVELNSSRRFVLNLLVGVPLATFVASFGVDM